MIWEEAPLHNGYHEVDGIVAVHSVPRVRDHFEMDTEIERSR